MARCWGYAGRVLRALASSLVLLSLGCDVYHPEAFEDADAGPGMDAGPEREDAGRPDAGPPDAGAPDAGPGDAGPSCILRRPPPRTAEADTGDRVLTFALRDIVLDQENMVWADIGYDHDGECTENVDQGTCVPRTGGVPQLDGPGGVDNLGGRQVLSLLEQRDPGIEADARRAQREGRYVIFVRIAGWNGLDDDSRVQVWFSQSLSASPDGGSPGDPLRWDGTDRFTLSEADFEAGDPTRPLLFDDLAYVADRQVVMHIPDGRPILLPWSAHPLELRLTDAFLTGTLNADATRLEDVTMTGRWALIDIQSVFTQLGLCPGTDERRDADILLNQFADIRGDPATDGLGATCDAYSIAVGFTGWPAVFADVASPPPFVNLCP